MICSLFLGQKCRLILSLINKLSCKIAEFKSFMDISEHFRIMAKPHMPLILIKIFIVAVVSYASGVGQVLNHITGTFASLRKEMRGGGNGASRDFVNGGNTFIAQIQKVK